MATTIAQIAYVKSTGEIEYTTSTGSEIPEHGSTSGDYTVRHILTAELQNLGYTIPTLDLFITRYWWKNNQWTDRGAPASNYYSFDVSSETWSRNTSLIEEEVRRERDLRLFVCDWTQGSDSPLSDEKKAEWRTYRQTLRDIMTNLPANLDDPNNVTWPTKPT